MRYSIKNLVLMVLMITAATAAWVMQPRILIADQQPKVNLEQLIPRQFGEWRELQQSTRPIVNPQQTAVLTKIYTQTLSRSYVNAAGDVIMLSIAYGANQSRDVALHYPEVCYPYQGFEVLSIQKGLLETGLGNIQVTRLTTQLGNRSEPITYWSILGDQVLRDGLATRLMRVRYAFKGQIPDGLIFRVSSISVAEKPAYELHGTFVRTLMATLTPTSRVQLMGKPTAMSMH
jgi:EpsI family protein